METKEQQSDATMESVGMSPDKVAEKFTDKINKDYELFQVTSLERQNDPRTVALTELINKQLSEAAMIREQAEKDLEKWRIAA